MGHQYQAKLLSHLGLSLHNCFKYFGNVADIDNVIFVLEGSLILTSNSHINKPHCLSNLGISFLDHFKCFGWLTVTGPFLLVNKL
jgi:hypothetical protein